MVDKYEFPLLAFNRESVVIINKLTEVEVELINLLSAGLPGHWRGISL